MNPSIQTTLPTDVLRGERHPLDAIFAPKSVAVVGATERAGSVGRTILWNLISTPFGGTVYPVNPSRPSILGIRAYPSVKAIPEPVELAVVVTPAATIPGVIGECADIGVKGAIVISAGFKETGPKGVELERQLLEQARRGNMRIVGPNCLGVMNPVTGINATFASAMARPGNIGFISQSGALCTAVLDWSFRENVGFSNFVSIGSMLDVGWGDLIYYLGDDPRTQAIVIYMETIGDARAFLSAAREVALVKPIIVIKPGRTEGAARAAASHTGSLTGSDEVLDAAFRRSGVLRVNNISDLFYMAEVLAKQPLPKGPRMTIVTNAGGPGVLATDALITEGGELTDVSPEAMKAYNELLPSAWSHNNPIDILGDAEPERYAKALEIAARDPNSDGMLVILTPQAMTDPTQTAEALRTYAKIEGKPVLASWMGGPMVAAGETILNRYNIPTFAYPDTAAKMFMNMWRYAYNLKGIYETPMPTDSTGAGPDRDLAREIINKVRNSGRTILTEFESKQLLAAYGIPTVDTRVAKSEEGAVKTAGEIGYPVVLKLNSETITHKTDVGGVQLNLRDADAVKRAYNAIADSVKEKVGAEHFQGVTVQPMVKLEGYELILGSSIDPQFGPVLLFGTGGQLVEVFKDRALALTPLNTTLARRMMSQTKIYKALQGVRGRKSVDMAALEQLMVRFSQLIAEQRWISELDINPLLASSEQLLALDARVVLHDLSVTEDKLPRLAIRAYPIKYVGKFTLKDGKEVTIRPIRPEDEPLLVKFHGTLSDRTVYGRYFQQLNLSQRVAHERLTRICFIDYAREMALVAEYKDENGETHILGVSRLTKVHGLSEGRFLVIVTDNYQHMGLGTELLRRIIAVARAENVKHVSADIMPAFGDMRRICEKVGFTIGEEGSAGLQKVEIEL
ncbi:MAG: bifunctional acetate--CoA ligase family protein/GNAT family N-acetyltransferase [Chloroflexi bacterium]|nr:bifunctional acetate--CoA ligase family protein/GNAT family N-acetyltransferase [Chloroflexota bacterium]MCL5273800.1 bifunctional acetate--CoA ligase family protein/GNAT family N-acetyltransferase [Chloroflexota bacterium]